LETYGKSKVRPVLPWDSQLTHMSTLGAVTGNRSMAIDCLQPAARGQIRPAIKIEPMNRLTEVR